MRSLANRLQSKDAKVRDGTMGGYAEGFAATEFSAAAMTAAIRGTVLGARDRALAGFRQFLV